MRIGSIPSALRFARLTALAIVATSSVRCIAQTNAPPAAPSPLAGFSTQPGLQPASPAVRAGIAANYGKLPISFEANRGQIETQVKFLASGSGYGIYLTGQEAVLTLHLPQSEAQRSKANQGASQLDKAHQAQLSKTDVVRMKLYGANREAKAEGVDPLPGTANYFVGNDRSKWQNGIPTYSKVRFSGVYPGVDLFYYGNQRQLEYDFVVAPKADPKAIQLRFEGARKVAITGDGDLAVSAKNGEIAFHKPLVYQETNGHRKPVEGGFTLLADKRVGFALGSYDQSKALVIDPVLAYSTYFPSPTQPNAIAVDSWGNAYLTGSSGSGFPTTQGAFQTKVKQKYEVSAFVFKLNASGTAVVYSTFLGGSGNFVFTNEGYALDLDLAQAIAVDGSGNAYLGGYTASSDFPVTNGSANRTPGQATGFVAELNSTGTALVYSTYLGGTGDGGGGNLVADAVDGISVDVSGDAYVTGYTYSSDFPVTAGAFQSTNNAGAILPTGFVTKLNPTGTKWLYSTYLGGSSQDQANAIAVDASGSAYVAGQTSSADFPVNRGAFQATPGGVFVTKLNPTGTALEYSTFLGDSSAYIGGIALDALGDAYVAGQTSSATFPVTPGAFQATYRAGNESLSSNAFVTELSPTGTALIYSTYLGGSGGKFVGDAATAIAVDGIGDAYVAGSAVSSDFPVTPGAFQSTLMGSRDAFVTKLNPTGTSLLYSTYLGGNNSSSASGIALDGVGNAFVAGATSSTNFPVTPWAYKTTPLIGFTTKLNLAQSAAPPMFSPDPGKYIGSVHVTLSDETNGATIYYTLEGSNPSTASAVYTEPITLTSHATVKAIAIADDYLPSAIAQASYSLIAQTPTPVIRPAPGSYPSGKMVTITDADATATIRYTTDGSTPTSHSNWYHGAIVLTGSETIQTIAVSSGDAESAVASASYTVH